MTYKEFSSRILSTIFFIAITLQCSMAKDTQQLETLSQSKIWKSLVYPEYSLKIQPRNFCFKSKSYCDQSLSKEVLRKQVQKLKRRFSSSVGVAKKLIVFVKEQQESESQNRRYFRRSLVLNRRILKDYFKKFDCQNRKILGVMIRDTTIPLTSILAQFRKVRGHSQAVIQNLDQLFYPEFLLDVKMILLLSKNLTARLYELTSISKSIKMNLSQSNLDFEKKYDYSLRAQTVFINSQVCSLCDPYRLSQSVFHYGNLDGLIGGCKSYREEMVKIISKFIKVESKESDIPRRRINTNDIQRVLGVALQDVNQNFKDYKILKFKAKKTNPCQLAIRFRSFMKVEGNKVVVDVCDDHDQDKESYIDQDYMTMMEEYIQLRFLNPFTNDVASSNMFQTRQVNRFVEFIINETDDKQQQMSIEDEYFV